MTADREWPADGPDFADNAGVILEVQVRRIGGKIAVCPSGPGVETPTGDGAIAAVVDAIADEMAAGRLDKNGPDEWIGGARVRKVNSDWDLAVDVGADAPAYRDFALSMGDALSRNIRSRGAA